MELKKALEEIKEALAKADLEAIKACTSPEEVYKNLQKYGLKISYEEMKEALEACSNEELSDEALEGIAGGRSWWGIPSAGIALVGSRGIIRCGGSVETPVSQATGTPGSSKGLGGGSAKSESTGGTSSSSGSVITQSGNATGGGKNIGIVGDVNSKGNVNIG